MGGLLYVHLLLELVTFVRHDRSEVSECAAKNYGRQTASLSITILGEVPLPTPTFFNAAIKCMIYVRAHYSNYPVFLMQEHFEKREVAVEEVHRREPRQRDRTLSLFCPRLVHSSAGSLYSC